jgi:hypothetical protein
LIQATPGFVLSSVYGAAYDYGTDGGPFVWYFDQGGNGVDIWQYDKAAGDFTGFVQDASGLAGYVAGNSIAGGLEYDQLAVPGKAILLGLVQQDFVFEYEISAGITPPPGGGDLYVTTSIVTMQF